MKISEFIEYLTQIQEEHGDLDVMEYSYNDYFDEYRYSNMNPEDFEVHDTFTKGKVLVVTVY